MEPEKVFQMPFSNVYPLLVNKAVRKGRSQAEVDAVIVWLTGYDQATIHQLADSPIAYGAFFTQAPAMNPARKEIKGTICGLRVEAIQDPLCGISGAWISWWMRWPKGSLWKTSWAWTDLPRRRRALKNKRKRRAAWAFHAHRERPPYSWEYGGPRLSKKWLAPLFRGFHSALAPTARPESYAGNPLERKGFLRICRTPPRGPSLVPSGQCTLCRQIR